MPSLVARLGAMGNTKQTNVNPDAGLRVFIVESSQFIRERLEQMIASIGGICCAGSATTADDAIRGILDTHPNAVILDIGLAQGSGFDVLRALQGRVSDTAFYVFSNFAIEPYRRLATRLGATRFFDKTTQIEDMRELLKKRAAEVSIQMH